MNGMSHRKPWYLYCYTGDSRSQGWMTIAPTYIVMCDSPSPNNLKQLVYGGYGNSYHVMAGYDKWHVIAI